jgi:FtsZ-binding cell division protein ZapB
VGDNDRSTVLMVVRSETMPNSLSLRDQDGVTSVRHSLAESGRFKPGDMAVLLTTDDYAALKAEVAQLRSERNDLSALLDTSRRQCGDREAEIERLRGEIAAWREKAAAWIATPEAAQRLDGYRELGDRAAKAEADRDELVEALRSYSGDDECHTYETDKPMGDCGCRWCKAVELIERLGRR